MSTTEVSRNDHQETWRNGRTLIIAPVGGMPGAVAAPVMTIMKSDDCVILVHTGPAPRGTQHQAEKIEKFLNQKNRNVSIDLKSKEDIGSIGSGTPSVDDFQSCVLLANGGEIDTVYSLITLIAGVEFDTIKKKFVAVSRDQNLQFFDMCGKFITTLSVNDTSTDSSNPRELLELLSLEPVKRTDSAHNEFVIGLKTTDVGGGKTWEPGIPLTLQEYAGFLVCTFDMSGKFIYPKDTKDTKDTNVGIFVEILEPNKQYNFRNATEWYRDYFE